MFDRNMLLAEVDSLRSQLGGRGNTNPATEMQLQQTNAALAQSHRDRDELIEFIAKISQQSRGVEATNATMEHLRARFGSSAVNNNGYSQHTQQGSSNNGELPISPLVVYVKLF
jgi:hypothetical protein